MAVELAKMVFCTYCGQSFTRDEHLERHILTREGNFFYVATCVHCMLTLRTRYQCQAVQMFHLSYELRQAVGESRIMD